MRPARESDSLPVITGLLVLFVAFVAMSVRTAPPRPLASDAHGSAFSADRALEVLRWLVGDNTPHPRRPGVESELAVLVAGHCDSVAAGPGASDAGVSVAVI